MSTASPIAPPETDETVDSTSTGRRLGHFFVHTPALWPYLVLILLVAAFALLTQGSFATVANMLGRSRRPGKMMSNWWRAAFQL
jgi:hypothetical protein